MAKTAKRGFSGYKGPSKEAVRAKAAGGGGFDSCFKREFKKYKIKDGKNLIRVLPPTWEDADYHAYDIFINYGIGPDNGNYLSLSKHGKGKDPIAEARVVANKEGDEKTAKALQPRERRAMWIIDRMDEDEGPQIFDAPPSLDKGFANLSFDEDTGEVIDFTSPDKGRDIRFYKEGKGLNTKYEGTKIKLMGVAPISEDDKQQDEWLEYISEHPVPDCLQFYDYAHISQIFDGTVATKDEDEDEDDKPRKGKSKPSRDDEDEDVKPKRRAPVDEDEDEDEREDEAPKKGRKSRSDDDSEDDEQPDRTRRGSGKARDDDPPFDANDDDEDVKPRKRTKVTSKSNDEDEDDEPAPKKSEGGSLRDKLKARRRSSDEDDDE